MYLEQVHTFGSLDRHPKGRVISTAFYSLVNIRHHQLKLSDNELHWHPVNEISEMAFDHKLILDTCYERMQQKIREEPIVFNLIEKKFSLRELQNLYEAILGLKLDRRNFRKKFFLTGLLLDTHELEKDVPTGLADCTGLIRASTSSSRRIISGSISSLRKNKTPHKRFGETPG